MGIVLDADERGIDVRWRQIRNKLRGHDYAFPENLDRGGTIIPEHDEKPRLGVWLMPNNTDPGMLEDF